MLIAEWYTFNLFFIIFPAKKGSHKYFLSCTTPQKYICTFVMLAFFGNCFLLFVFVFQPNKVAAFSQRHICQSSPETNILARRTSRSFETAIK